MTTYDPLLVAEVESAMRIQRCDGQGCIQASSWHLVAPCGHVSRWCHICHHEVSERVSRRVESGTTYVCAGDGQENAWAGFKWVTVE